LPIVQTGTTKKITITELTGTQVSAAGEVGIGGDTTGVVAGVSVTSKFCVKNEGANPVAGFVHVNDTTANSGSNTFACRSRGTLAVPTIVQNNDSLWNMYIAGNDGTDLALAAEIRVEVDGTPGSNDMPGRILLRTTPDGSQAPVDAVKIDSAQNVTVSAGNLVIGTSGKGIDFSATPGTGTSELLDDYEEGTFTATLTSTTTPPNTPPTVTGYYTKVGEVVNVRIWFNGVDTTGGTGFMIITGLPFTSRNNGDAGRVIGEVLSRGLSVPDKYNVAFLDSNTTTLYFISVADNAAWTDVTISSGSGKYLAVNITYATAS
jgi:hypothetical protein